MTQSKGDVLAKHLFAAVHYEGGMDREAFPHKICMFQNVFHHAVVKKDQSLNNLILVSLDLNS